MSYSEGVFVGYRWFDEKRIEPQFPFGFGLSYTTFELSNLRTMVLPRPDPLPAGTPSPVTFAEARVTVKNTGTREGSQVVQLYITQDKPTVSRPPRELKGFTKVLLKPGESREVGIPIPFSALTHYDTEKHGWLAEAGDYTIQVGDSSRNLPQKVTVKLDSQYFTKEGQ